MNENDDLRELFQGAASEIRPQGSLDDILDRTKKVDPMTRRWFLPVVAAAAVIGLAIGGAAWLANDSGSPKGAGNGPVAPVPTTATTPEGGKPVDKALPIYWVGDTPSGQRLFRTFLPQTNLCPERDCQMTVAAGRAVLGSATDGDFETLWPSGSDLIRVTYTDDLITVDLAGSVHDRPAGLTADQAGLSLQQVVYTVQAVLGKGRLPVQFTINGNHTDTVLGVPASEPIAEEPEQDVLAAVQISSPYDGQHVAAGDFVVSGVAAVFEANVVWELLVGGDAVVQQGHTLATECCKLSPYEFTLKNLEPGTYTLVVHDSDESGQGLPVNQDTKEIVVE